MAPRSRTVRISEDVFRRLQERAKPLEDTPNSVIEALLDRDDHYSALALDQEAPRPENDLGLSDQMDTVSEHPKPWPKSTSAPTWKFEQAISDLGEGFEPVDSSPSTELTELERKKVLEQSTTARAPYHARDAMSGSRIILSPASVTALEHYENTIRGPVALSRIKHLVTEEEWQRLTELYPNGQAQIWGARPGPRNRKNFARIKDNDIVLFYRNRTYFSSYRVTTKLGRQATELAKELWGTDGDGNTWDLIYFLSDGRDENIPVGELWKIAGQGPKTLVRGLWILDGAPSARCIAHFGLERS